MSEFSHINQRGEASMVDVSNKAATVREARAEGYVRMSADTLQKILAGEHHKGDVFSVARIAGIQAAKQTSQLIPLCHPLMLTKVAVDFEAQPGAHHQSGQTHWPDRRGNGSAYRRICRRTHPV